MFQRQARIIAGRNASAVIAYFNRVVTHVLEPNFNARRARIQGILQKLLHDSGEIKNNLVCADTMHGRPIDLTYRRVAHD